MGGGSGRRGVDSLAGCFRFFSLCERRAPRYCILLFVCSLVGGHPSIGCGGTARPCQLVVHFGCVVSTVSLASRTAYLDVLCQPCHWRRAYILSAIGTSSACTCDLAAPAAWICDSRGHRALSCTRGLAAICSGVVNVLYRGQHRSTARVRLHSGVRLCAVGRRVSDGVVVIVTRRARAVYVCAHMHPRGGSEWPTPRS